MNVGEQMRYILRLAVISISAVLLVVILALGALEVGPTTHLHADTHVAAVMNSAEFWVQPGVIDVDEFSNESLPQYADRTTDENVYADIRLQLPNANKTIVSNPRAKQILEQQRGLRGVYTEDTIVPVSTTQGEIATLHIEVVYVLQ